jgi:hypothetical protein
VKKFTNRKAAVSRIWTAIQSLAPDSAPQVPPVAPKKARAARGANGEDKATSLRAGSKTAQTLDLLKRDGGATLAEIIELAGWQAHSVRGFISGALGKKMGLIVESVKREDGQCVYSIAK